MSNDQPKLTLARWSELDQSGDEQDARAAGIGGRA